MHQRHAAWRRSIYMQLGHAVLTCTFDVQQGHAAGICSMDMEYGYGAWTCSMDSHDSKKARVPTSGIKYILKLWQRDNSQSSKRMVRKEQQETPMQTQCVEGDNSSMKKLWTGNSSRRHEYRNHAGWRERSRRHKCSSYKWAGNNRRHKYRDSA
jgi:hypothetical protein